MKRTVWWALAAALGISGMVWAQPPPSFLSAGNKAQRCAAIGAWIDATRQAARGRDMNNIYFEYIWGLAAPSFERFLGKPYLELTEKERKRLADGARDCSKELWVKTVLASGLDRDPARGGDGATIRGIFTALAAAVARAQQSQAAEVARAQQLQERDRLAREAHEASLRAAAVAAGQGIPVSRFVEVPAHYAYELLTETPLAKVFLGGLPVSGRAKSTREAFCRQNWVLVALVFKVPRDYVIADDEAYWRLVEDHVVPAVDRACVWKNYDEITIRNFVDDYRLISPSGMVTDKKLVYGPGEPYAIPVAETKSIEQPLSMAVRGRAASRRGFVRAKNWPDESIDALRTASLEKIAEAGAAAEIRARLAEEEMRLPSQPHPFAGSSAAYLNHVYNNNLGHIDALDKDVARSLEFGTAALQESGMYSLLGLLSGGRLEPEATAEAMSKALASVSRVGPIAVAYVISYERFYPSCMDASPLVFTQTTIIETIGKRGYQELYRYQDAPITENFRVNRRFAEVLANLSSVTDSFRLISGGELQALQAGMRTHACDSAVMRQFEANLVAKFRSVVATYKSLKEHYLGRIR